MERCGRIFACLLFLLTVSAPAMNAQDSSQSAQSASPQIAQGSTQIGQGTAQIAQSNSQILSTAVTQEIGSVVPNFGIVSSNLFRGGQPQVGGLDALKKAGVKTIVNLRDGIEDIESERKLAKKLGLKFVSIPMSVFKTASKKQVDQFLNVVRDPASQPVFVHCRQGMDRCGTMVAMYRMKQESWSARQAYDEMLKYGFHPFLLGLRWSVFANDATTLSAKALPANSKPIGADLPIKPSTPIRKGNSSTLDSES